jgi:hypothetical protein
MSADHLGSTTTTLSSSGGQVADLRFGRGGDGRMLQVEALPAAARREAIYGVAAD